MVFTIYEEKSKEGVLLKDQFYRILILMESIMLEL